MVTARLLAIHIHYIAWTLKKIYLRFKFTSGKYFNLKYFRTNNIINTDISKIPLPGSFTLISDTVNESKLNPFPLIKDKLNISPSFMNKLFRLFSPVLFISNIARLYSCWREIDCSKSRHLVDFSFSKCLHRLPQIKR